MFPEELERENLEETNTHTNRHTHAHTRTHGVLAKEVFIRLQRVDFDGESGIERWLVLKNTGSLVNTSDRGHHLLGLRSFIHRSLFRVGGCKCVWVCVCVCVCVCG